MFPHCDFITTTRFLKLVLNPSLGERGTKELLYFQYVWALGTDTQTIV
jgi:hypothetical protein